MSKSVIMTTSRLDKEFSKLRDGNFKLRSESVICSKKLKMRESDKNKLRTMKVHGYLDYPVVAVGLSFVNPDRPLVEVNITLYINDRGMCEFMVSDEHIEEDGVPVVSTDERYSICMGDDIPDKGIYGEEFNTFELRGSEPFFYEKFSKMGLLLDNKVLWSVFNNIDLYENSSDSNSYTLTDIPLTYYDDIKQLFVESGFSDVQVVMQDGLEVFMYANSDGSCCVHMSVGSSISLSYSDMYMGSDVFSEAAFSVDTIGDIAIPGSLMSSHYRSIMLNGEIGEALFRLDTLNLDELLEVLHNDGYRIDNLGLVRVTSIISSITVCGFKGKKDYMYVIFYFNEEICSFMVKILSCSSKRDYIMLNGVKINLFDMGIHDTDATSTLIRGFDFENFREYELV